MKSWTTSTEPHRVNEPITSEERAILVNRIRKLLDRNPAEKNILVDNKIRHVSHFWNYDSFIRLFERTIDFYPNDVVYIGGGGRKYTREQAKEMLENNKFYAYADNLLKLKTSSPFSKDCFTIKNGDHDIRVHSNSRGATVTYLYGGMMVFEGASFSDLFGLDNLNQLINHVNNA